MKKVKEENSLRDAQRLGEVQRWILKHVALTSPHDCYGLHLTLEYNKEMATKASLKGILDYEDMRNQTMDQALQPLLARHYLNGEHEDPSRQSSKKPLDITPKGVDASQVVADVPALEIQEYRSLSFETILSVEDDTMKLAALKWSYKDVAPELFNLQFRIIARYMLEHDLYDDSGNYTWPSLDKGLKMRMVRTTQAAFYNDPLFNFELHVKAMKHEFSPEKIFRVSGTRKSDLQTIKKKLLTAFDSLEDSLPQ